MKALFAAVFTMTLVMAAGAAPACDRPAGAAGIEAELAGWINAERAKKGLSKLGVSAGLERGALAHACDMASRGFFAHEGPGGPAFGARMKKTGYRFGAAVENIAKSGDAGADTAARIWRKSSAHWANILDRRLDDMGVAVATDGRNVFYVFIGAGK